MLKNIEAILLSYFKLCTTCCSHWWFQTWVTVRKHSLWVKIGDFFVLCELKISQMTLNNNRTPFRSHFKLCASFCSYLLNQTIVTNQNCTDWGNFWHFCDLDIWSLTWIFCMGITSFNDKYSTSFNDKYSWKFNDDTITKTLCDRQTVRTVYWAAWSQLKISTIVTRTMLMTHAQWCIWFELRRWAINSSWWQLLYQSLHPFLHPLHAKFFRGNIKHIFKFHVTPLLWYDTGSWNLSLNKTRTYPFYLVNIMAARVLATQGARTSAGMILI